MEKMVTTGKKEDIDDIGVLFAIIVFICSSLLIFFVTEGRKKPSYLIIAAISSVDKLEERIMVMEKSEFNDSDYRQAKDIKTELELVRDKLIEIKIKLKDNKHWAD